MFQPGSLDRPHPMSRRRFLGCAGAIATGGVSLPVVARVLAPDTSAKRKILFLGGTEYLGPATVSSALRAGHEVTLFNRGRTNPHLFPDLEKLRGDRYPDRGEGLAALGGTRQWDAVIDTWQGPPVLVDQTAELLTGRVGSYVWPASITETKVFCSSSSAAWASRTRCDASSIKRGAVRSNKRPSASVSRSR